LLTDDDRRLAMRKRAYAVSRTMTWERTAERYMAAFENAAGSLASRLSRAPIRALSNRTAPLRPT